MNKKEIYNKSIERLMRTDVSMLSYDKLFKQLTYQNSDELKISAEKLITHWKKSRKTDFGKNLKFVFYLPFCNQKCLYCREPSTKIVDYKEIDRYIEDSILEMKFFSKIFKGQKIDYFTFNGGSPDILKPSQLKFLLDSLFFNFKINVDVTRRIEFNPLGLNREKVKILKKFGINRISLGVQSLTKKALYFAKRPYVSISLLTKIMEVIKEEGFDYVNVDLIMGLPGESYIQFEKGLKRIFNLKPTQIMIYVLNEPNDCYLKEFPELNVVKFRNGVEFMMKSFLNSNFLKEVEKSGYVLVPGRDNVNYRYFVLVRKDAESLNWLGNIDSLINIRTFVIGKRNVSNIPADLMYERIGDFNPKLDIYRGHKVDQNYEIKKFIFASVESFGRVDLKLYSKIFNHSIHQKFSLALDILAENKRIKIKNEILSFLNRDSKNMLMDLAFLISNMDEQ